MASINKKTGAIQWQFPRRGTLRLGRGANKRVREQVKSHIETLSDCKRYNTAIPDHTKKWLAKVDPAIKAKLCGYGLVEDSGAPQGLKAFTDWAITKLYDAEKNAGTIQVVRTAEKAWLQFFDDAKPMHSFTVSDVNEFKAFSLNELKHQPGYVKTNLCKLRWVLNRAREKQLLHVNPFAGVELPKQGEDKKEYVPVATIKKVLASCDDYWKLAICLSRFGGLRLPSDGFDLRWDEVDFMGGSIKANRTKTGRLVPIPISPELNHTLRVVQELTGDSDYVFPAKMRRYSEKFSSAANTQLGKLIKKSGVDPWAHRFNSMRTSWGKDLENAGLSTATVAHWLDHTPQVHQQHYNLKAIDSDFTKVHALNSGVFK